MDEVRRRMAIGTFSGVEDARATLHKLAALDVTGQECFALPPGIKSDEPALLGALGHALNLDDVTGPIAGQLVLRVLLSSPADEQLVARILLESKAASVQLHDVD